ncbi:hypothetical protein SPB21_04050 [Leptothoe sp. ISB3NOV94-8A]
MNKIAVSVKQKISVLAQEGSPYEVCGFVLADDSLHVAENIAHEYKQCDPGYSDARETHFAIDPDSQSFFEENRDRIKAVFHSHTSPKVSGYLSPDDVHNSIAANVPYVVYHCHPDFESWDLFDPDGLHPYPLERRGSANPSSLAFYLGWRFEFPRSDCLTLFRNYFRGKLGIEIRNYPRPKRQQDCFVEGWDAYRENFSREGFVKLPEGATLRANDILLSTLVGVTPHHVSIVIDPEKKTALHLQEPGMVSELYVHSGPIWENRTKSAWRHRHLT